MRQRISITIRRQLSLCLVVLLALVAQAQPDDKWRKAATDFQAELVRQYADTSETPLSEEERRDFRGLTFFPVRKGFYVEARWERTPDAQPFEMPTVSGKTKTFVQYGRLHFRIKGKPFVLAAYQNLKLATKAEYADDLFVPFKDLSSGRASYGGGRYMDIKIPKGATTWLDFNQCYNPYCAYSKGWNCPIPPVENYLAIKVLAGVRAYSGDPADH